MIGSGTGVQLTGGTWGGKRVGRGGFGPVVLHGLALVVVSALLAIPVHVQATWAGQTQVKVYGTGKAAAAPGEAANFIDLRRTRIDTRSGPVSPLGVLSAAGATRRLKLIQFAGPPSDAALEELIAAGATIVQYVPHNAYLVWTEKDTAEAVKALATGSSAFRFYDDYQAAYALSPRLDSALGNSDLVKVTVQFFGPGAHKNNDVARVQALASAVLGGPWEVLGGRYVNVRLAIQGTQLESIAQVDSVVTIEPYVSPGPMTSGKARSWRRTWMPAGKRPRPRATSRGWPAKASRRLPRTTRRSRWLTMAWTTARRLPSKQRILPAQQRRGAQPHYLCGDASGSATASAVGPDGHGNINASILAGYNDSAGTGVEDGVGFNYGLGISPYGRLANVRIFTPGFDNGFGNASMVDDYYSRGARLSTNSWARMSSAATTHLRKSMMR